MIDDSIEAIAFALLGVLIMILLATNQARVGCNADHVVGGVDRNGKITCLEKIKEPCCGEPAGIVCEKACKPSRAKYKRIYCTNGYKPVVKDHTTVGCTR